MNNLEIKEYKNKYRVAAEEIYFDLGSSNYRNAVSCMTRFRAKIIDKKAVDVEKIKNLPLVKAINWNGDEIQIIIGGEVIKVIDEFHKYEDELAKSIEKNGKNEILIKKTVGARFLSFLTGVMVPAIPLLMAAGLIMAIYNLLTLPGQEILTKTVKILQEDGTLKDVGISMASLHYFDIPSALFFILSQVILNSIGVYFIYNTTKYFKGNISLALAVGITLMSRGFFPDATGVPYANAHFGDWIGGLGDSGGKTGFLLFKLRRFPIVVGGYEGTMIPYIVGGLVVVYLDKWVKNWMPSSVDIVFRPAIVYVVSLLGLWFLLAPIASLIEFAIITVMNWLGAIPYGIGTGLMGFLWQPLVITGTHTVLGTAMGVAINTGSPSMLRAANAIAVLGQIGAVIGVAIMTKNITLKKVAIGTLPAGIFGITEPIIYGINLPKIKPFLMGCIAGGIGAVVSGILKIDIDVLPADGFLTILSFTGHEGMNGPLEMGLAVLTWLIAIGLGIGLVLLFYTERKNELNYFKKGVKKLANIIYVQETKKFKLSKSFKTNEEQKSAMKETKEKKLKLIKSFKVDQEKIKTMKDEYKKMDKYYSDISRVEQQLVTIENKESKKRTKMYKKLVNLKDKLMKKDDKELYKKFTNLNEAYSNYNLDKNKKEIQIKLKKIQQNNQEIIENFKKQKEEIYQDSTSKIEKQIKPENKKQLISVENMFWNALNSVEIGFQVKDAKPISFKNKGE